MRPSVHFRIVAEARESEDMVSGQEQLLMAYAQADIAFSVACLRAKNCASADALLLLRGATCRLLPRTTP
jgi:hypothetical protein